MLDVCRFDVVPERRAQDVHGQYRTTKPALLAEPGESRRAASLLLADCEPRFLELVILGTPLGSRAYSCWVSSSGAAAAARRHHRQLPRVFDLTECHGAMVLTSRQGSAFPDRVGLNVLISSDPDQ